MTTPRQSMPETREALQERARVVELERQRLVQLRDAAVRDRNNAAKLSVLVILAVPAFVFWGFWIALTGITQASLSNYENGKRDMPLSTLLGVAAALNVSLGDLLDLPEVIVVRDSLLGRAVEQLQTRVPLAAGAAEAAL